MTVNTHPNRLCGVRKEQKGDAYARVRDDERIGNL